MVINVSYKQFLCKITTEMLRTRMYSTKCLPFNLADIYIFKNGSNLPDRLNKSIMSEKFLCVSKVFITVDFKYEIKIEYFTKPNFASWNIQKLSNYYA